MTTTAVSLDQSGDSTAGGRSREKRSWRWWLAPRPFTLAASIAYLLTFAVVAISELGPAVWTWRGPAALGALWALAVVDRLELRRWGESPPLRVAIPLLLLRLALIEGVIQIGDVWNGVLLYWVLIYLASYYAGIRGSVVVAVLAWIALLWRMIDPLAWFGIRSMIGDAIDAAGFLTMMFGFALAMAYVRVRERASRMRAEAVLGELQQAHARLEHYAGQALADVNERNRLARSIHDMLGQSLTAISVQLEKAIAFRPRDPDLAEQAVRDAKRLGSEALGDVRRSVGSLRASSTRLPFDNEAQEFERPSPRASRVRTWLRWLMPRPFDLAPTAVYVAVFLMHYSWTVREWKTWSSDMTVWLGIVALLLLIDRLDHWIWRGRPPVTAAVALLGARVLLFGAILAAGAAWYLLWLVPLAPYYGYMYFGTRGGDRLSFAAWLTLLIIAMIGFRNDGAVADVNEYVGGLVMISFLLLLVVTTSKIVLRDRFHRARAESLLDDLRATHAQLRRYAKQSLDATAARNHLAREIHDGLGHYLTVINVQLEKALAFRSIDAAAADEAVQDAKRLTSEALHEVRGARYTLDDRGAGFSLNAALERLIANLRDEPVIDLRVEGNEDGFSHQSLVTLYRVVQEGLTNIRKHAAATRVSIQLALGEDAATLALRDDGRGFDPAHVASGERASSKSGYGLQGARERLELIGGLLAIESVPGGGTELRAIVPKDPLARPGRPDEPRHEAKRYG